MKDPAHRKIEGLVGPVDQETSSVMTPADSELLSRLVGVVETFTYHVLMFHMPDANQYCQLTETINECAVAWSSRDAIPKLAVNALIDLQPILLGEALHLTDVEQRKVLEDMAIELGDTIRSVVPLLPMAE
jgi:predicted xylose isomerase-like sugar epimerase